MENFKSKLQENKKFILVLILTALVTSLTMIFIYNYKINGFSSPILSPKSNTINEIVLEINKINSNLKNCLNKGTLNNKSTVEILKSNLNELDKTKETLSSVVLLDDNSREIYPKLVSSIESTQNFYNYCIYVLDTTNSSDITNSVAKLNELEFDLIQSYNELKDLDVLIQFNDDAILFVNTFNNYLSNLESLNKINQIKTTKSAEFLNAYSSIVTRLSNLVEDVTPAILKIREDNRSLDIILDNISEKEDELAEISNSINKISIPEGYLSYYNNLNDYIKIYVNYLDTLELAVIYEKSSSSYKDNKKNIDKNYENASSKYEDVEQALDSLNKSVKNS